jgi:hypothetical protein
MLDLRGYDREILGRALSSFNLSAPAFVAMASTRR